MCFEQVPEHVSANYNYANFLKEEGKVEEAAIHYKEALKISPGHISAS